eukprot:9093588-Alexandrium_andersonii.AAC.1
MFRNAEAGHTSADLDVPLSLSVAGRSVRGVGSANQELGVDKASAAAAAEAAGVAPSAGSATSACAGAPAAGAAVATMLDRSAREGGGWGQRGVSVSQAVATIPDVWPPFWATSQPLQPHSQPVQPRPEQHSFRHLQALSDTSKHFQASGIEGFRHSGVQAFRGRVNTAPREHQRSINRASRQHQKQQQRKTAAAARQS